MLPKFSYVRPDKLDQAVKYLERDHAAIHAGGTDLLGCLREGIMDSSLLVSISGLKDLAGIKETGDGGLRIGSLTTITEVAENRMIAKKYPGLACRGCQPPVAQPGNTGRQSLPETALLVLPRRVSLPAQRRRTVFCRQGREPVPCHIRS